MSVSTPGQDVAPDILDAPTAGAQAIRGSATRAVGYVAGTLVTVASAPLLIRHLGVVQFGRYTIVVSLVALVQGVTDVGLASVALREYSVRGGPDREAFMRSVLGARLLLTTVGVGIAAAFAALVGYGTDLVEGTLLAGLALVLANYTATLSIPLMADLRLGRLTLIDVAGKAVGVALVVILVLASARLVPFLAVPLLPAVGMLAVVALLTRGKVSRRPALAFGELGVLLRETLPLAVATILSTVYARVVILVMSLVASGEVTGYFGLASRVLEIAVGVPLALVGTALPILSRAARDDHERLRYTLQSIFDVALIAGIWMAGVLALGAPTIVSVLGGPEARPAATALRILSFALVAVFLTVTWQHGLLSLRRHRALLGSNALGLAVIVVLAFVLVPALGARGGAVAVVGGELSLVLASGFALFGRSPLLRPRLRTVPRVLLAAGASVAASQIPGLPDALRPVVATLVYFPLLFALGAIPHELRAALLVRRPPVPS